VWLALHRQLVHGLSPVPLRGRVMFDFAGRLDLTVSSCDALNPSLATQA
jgi:hypothetical protein